MGEGSNKNQSAAPKQPPQSHFKQISAVDTDLKYKSSVGIIDGKEVMSGEMFLVKRVQVTMELMKKGDVLAQGVAFDAAFWSEE